MHSPHVLLMNRVYPPQRFATGRLLHDLARGFAEEGWQVSIITTGPKSGSEQDGTIRIHRTKGPERPKLASYPWLLFKLFRLARKVQNPDLIVSMTDPPMLCAAASRLARQKKAKHLHWCQDYYPGALTALKLKPPAFIFKRLLAANIKAMKASEKIIVIGRCMADRLKKDGIESSRISLIPNWPNKELGGTSGDPAHFADKKGQTTRRQNAKPFEKQVKSGLKFRVLYAGNLGRAHPIEPILNAAEILQKDNPDIEFVFVGDGRRFDKMAEERTRRELENIRFLPYQPAEKLKSIMESGDVHLISLSRAAGGYMVPSKLYAAFGAERPVIFMGPGDSETARTITDFKAGTCVPPGDAKELAKAIQRYFDDGDHWFAAYNGAKEAKTVFTPKESIRAFIKRALKIVQETDKSND